jgi:hypothetical protein
MTVSHALVSSVLLSGVVFAATTVPLTLFGSQPVTVKLEEKPVFSGRLEELATPYLSFATAVSLGVGAATFGLLCWQTSARKLSRAEEQIAALKQQVQEKEALLEYLKFSDSRLQTAGLDSFLGDDAVSYQMMPQIQPIHQEHKANSFVPVGLRQQPELRVNSHPVEAQSPSHHPYNLDDATQVQALLVHLKQIMGQIENLQGSQSQSAAQKHLMNNSGTIVP